MKNSVSAPALDLRTKSTQIGSRAESALDLPVGAPTASLQRKTIVVLTTACVLLAIVYGLWLTRIALLVVFAGCLVALALSSICKLIEARSRLRRRWSLPFVLLAGIGILALGIWLRGPAIETEIDRLQTSLPQAASAFVAHIREQQWGQWMLTHIFGTEQVPRLMDVWPKITGVVSGTLGLLGGLVIVIFLGITIAAEPEVYGRGVEQLFPCSAQSYVNRVIREVGDALRVWLIARLVSMCGVGMMVWLGLWILNVPMAGTLGLLAALLTFVPNLGPILSAIPPILLAFTISPKHAVLVILLFWVAHGIEGLVLTPIAQRAIVRLPPALTLSAQLVLASLAGGLGIALAAPLTVVAMVLIRTVYREKVLND